MPIAGEPGDRLVAIGVVPSGTSRIVKAVARAVPGRFMKPRWFTWSSFVGSCYGIPVGSSRGVAAAGGSYLFSRTPHRVRQLGGSAVHVVDHAVR